MPSDRDERDCQKKPISKAATPPPELRGLVSDAVPEANYRFGPSDQVMVIAAVRAGWAAIWVRESACGKLAETFEKGRRVLRPYRWKGIPQPPHRQSTTRLSETSSP